MTSPPFLPALRPVVEAFEVLRVPYYIGGSVASSVYGEPRTTIDVDLIADLRSEHVLPLVENLGGDFYVAEERIRQAVRLRRSFNVIHLDTMLKVDIFVSKRDTWMRESFRRRRTDTLEDREDAQHFQLASPEDVVLAKLDWYREGGESSKRQWLDILGVLRTQGSELDVPYMRAWAEHLNVADLLERALLESSE